MDLLLEDSCEVFEKDCDKKCVSVQVSQVCGSNGTTYDNICLLHCDRVNFEFNGPCKEICVCDQEYDPVCGIDGVTYNNECLMNCAKIRLFKN